MKFKCNLYWATIYQLLISLLLLWLTRFAFYYYNVDIVGEISFSQLIGLCFSGLRFDLVALAYANALFIVMRFLPFRFVMKRWWRRAAMVVYAVANSALLIVSIGDIPFFRFNNGRLHLDAFMSLLNWDMAVTTFSYFSRYWWAFLSIVALIMLMVWLATRVRITGGQARNPWARAGIFVLVAGLTFIAMRGHVVGRPIGIDSAAAEVEKPAEINVVLNTPFCIMRSANYSREMETRVWFSDEVLASLRSSRQTPAVPLAADSIKQAVSGKNLMLIVLESGGQIWLDSLNIVQGDSVRCLMPFLDSIACKSLALTSTYCTGSRTVEGLASIIGGVPTFGPLNWMATKYGALTVDAPARLLAGAGYDTQFFLGAKPASFALGSLARAMGFSRVTGIDDVDIPSKGTRNSWGVYDHIMASYVAENISGMSSPFFAGWLTLDLHSPFNIPAGWNDAQYRPVDSDMERCVEYTDYSLRCFFEAAAKQPWYDNTLFVITADHGFRDFTEPKYNDSFIYGHIPFLLYTPDGSLAPAKCADRPMSQFDIPATLLWLAGYKLPYISVGTNWFDDTKPHYGLQMRNDMWCIASSRYLVRLPYAADRIDAVFDITVDQQMLNPLTDYDHAEVDSMLTWFKAFLQDYTTRANNGQLTIAD